MYHNRAVKLVTMAAIAASLIAPLNAFVAGVDSLFVIGVAFFIAGLVHLAVIRPEARNIFRYPKKALAYGLSGGIVLMISYVAFLEAMALASNKVIPTLVYEMYPILIIMFSYFMRFREKITLGKVLAIGMCITGLCYLSLGDMQSLGQLSFNGSVIGLATLSVIAAALGMVMTAKASDFIGNDKEASKMGSYLARIGGFIVVLPYIVQADPITQLQDFNTVLAIMVYGILILSMMCLWYYEGIRLSKSHIINMIFTLTPVLSVLWIIMLGKATLTSHIVIAGLMILSANLFMNMDAQFFKKWRRSKTPEALPLEL